MKPKKIHVEGIRHVSALDIKFAGELGYTIKLLGIVKRIDDLRLTVDESKSRPARKSNIVNRKCRVQVSVYPTLIPNAHVLASVNHVFNAVFVRGDIVGDTLFYGRGAGKDATASAVLSDLADAALDLKFGTKHRVPPFVPHECSGAVAPMDDVMSQYFVRLDVVDRPGVLAKIAAIFGQSKIGISSVIQPEGHEGKSVPLIFMIHDARNGAVRKALATNWPAARGQKQARDDSGGKFRPVRRRAKNAKKAKELESTFVQFERGRNRENYSRFRLQSSFRARSGLVGICL